MSLEAQKAQMKRMVLINVVCGVVAIAAAFGAIAGDITPLWALFAVALAAGFAAQIRFILAVKANGGGEA
ncbi:MAG: hypothetical protein IT546_00125 [Caulobacteraceae bacterium]|nr:hypothetical protein [Caulobacteraceae bacterium]